MKKTLSVLVIAILALGAVFAYDNTVVGLPGTLYFQYEVDEGYNLCYGFKYIDGQNDVDLMDNIGYVTVVFRGPDGYCPGDVTVGTIAEWGGTVQMWDSSVVCTKDPVTITISFGQPTPWTNTETNYQSESQPDVQVYAAGESGFLGEDAVPDGIESLTSNSSGYPRTLTIVYGTDPVDFFHESGWDYAVHIADLEISWPHDVVPPGTYESEMKIEYTMP